MKNIGFLNIVNFLKCWLRKVINQNRFLYLLQMFELVY